MDTLMEIFMNRYIVIILLTGLLSLPSSSVEAKLSRKQIAFTVGSISLLAVVGYLYRDTITTRCEDLKATLIRNPSFTSWVTGINEILKNIRDEITLNF
jgi:hypothetical protein